MWARAIRGTAGVSSPRPCPVLAWGVAGSLLIHATLLAMAWQHQPTTHPPTAARLSVRLLPPTARHAAAPTAAPAVVVRHAAVRPRAPAAATHSKPPQTVAVAAAPAEVIDGSVFGLPRIGFAAPAPARWMAPQPPAPTMPPPVPLLQMQAQAARDAGLAQIMSALQQQVSAWQTPQDAGDAACSLDAQPQRPLACDSDALLQVVGERVTMLSGLLDAYRRMEPRAASLSIAFVQGRYRVSLAMASDLR